jgi:hypothetical protein
VQGLDRAVRLSAAGADQRMPDAELGERLTEVAGAKLATVVAEHSFQPRASAGPRATLSLCARGSTQPRRQADGEALIPHPTVFARRPRLAERAEPEVFGPRVRTRTSIRLGV